MNPRQHPLGRFLSDVEKHYRLPDQDRQALLDLPLRERQLDAGSYLVREGSVPSICSVLVDGFAYRQKVTGDGGRQILSVCIAGDAIDLQNIFLDISDHAVQMLTRGRVADIQRDALQ